MFKKSIVIACLLFLTMETALAYTPTSEDVHIIGQAEMKLDQMFSLKGAPFKFRVLSAIKEKRDSLPSDSRIAFLLWQIIDFYATGSNTVVPSSPAPVPADWQRIVSLKDYDPSSGKSYRAFLADHDQIKKFTIRETREYDPNLPNTYKPIVTSQLTQWETGGIVLEPPLSVWALKSETTSGSYFFPTINPETLSDTDLTYSTNQESFFRYNFSTSQITSIPTPSVDYQIPTHYTILARHENIIIYKSYTNITENYQAVYYKDLSTGVVYKIVPMGYATIPSVSLNKLGLGLTRNGAVLWRTTADLNTPDGDRDDWTLFLINPITGKKIPLDQFRQFQMSPRNFWVQAEGNIVVWWGPNGLFSYNIDTDELTRLPNFWVDAFVGNRIFWRDQNNTFHVLDLTSAIETRFPYPCYPAMRSVILYSPNHIFLGTDTGNIGNSRGDVMCLTNIPNEWFQ